MCPYHSHWIPKITPITGLMIDASLSSYKEQPKLNQNSLTCEHIYSSSMYICICYSHEHMTLALLQFDAEC